MKMTASIVNDASLVIARFFETNGHRPRFVFIPYAHENAFKAEYPIQPDDGKYMIGETRVMFYFQHIIDAGDRLR